MNESISFKDFLKFFKEYKKQIIIGFILSLVILLFFIFYSMRSLQNVVSKDKEVESFSFILENKEGVVISNTGVVKSVLVGSLIESSKIINQEEKESIIEATSINFDTASSLMSVLIDNSNLDTSFGNLADIYFNCLNNGELKYFDNKNIYMMDRKPIRSTVSDNVVGSVNFIDKKKIAIYMIVWIVLGVGIGSILVFKRNYGNEAIKNKFYLSNETVNIDIEKFEFLSKTEELKEINALINSPKKNKFIVSDKTLLKKMNNYSDCAFFTTSLSEVSSATFNPSEILIICIKNETSKNWYNLQLELAKNYDASTKSIFISGQ